jgi:cytochrome c oxidase assembly protein subunit 15
MAQTDDSLLWRRYWTLLGVVAAQGTLGFVQYWAGVPEVLVSLHVLGAVSAVIAMAGFWVGGRDRGPRPEHRTAPAELARTL